ncbi:MAG TPA: DUF2946 family protein [Pseudolabrys sp.]|nr:DUF2946 family protein [Pseudolabrys sp.]
MRGRVRPFLSGLAIFAIVLHTLLWAALTPLIAAPSVDPFTVICHSEATGADDQASSHGPLTPAHACEHCNLCSAVAPPMPGMALAAIVEPARILQVLRPLKMARHEAIAADPKLARGPPIFA